MILVFRVCSFRYVLLLEHSNKMSITTDCKGDIESPVPSTYSAESLILFRTCELVRVGYEESFACSSLRRYCISRTTHVLPPWPHIKIRSAPCTDFACDSCFCFWNADNVAVECAKLLNLQFSLLINLIVSNLDSNGVSQYLDRGTMDEKVAAGVHKKFKQQYDANRNQTDGVRIFKFIEHWYGSFAICHVVSSRYFASEKVSDHRKMNACRTLQHACS